MNDLGLLIAAARAAAPLALDRWKTDQTVWHKDDGAGPVSEADYAVDAALKAHLTAARPDYGWLSEETPDDAARLSRRSVFVVDPIDGTRAYVAGEDTWALSLAVVTDGVPVAAAVFLPAKDRLFSAASGEGAMLNNAAIRASTPDSLTGARVLANKAAFEPHHWPGGVPDVSRHFRPSLAYRMCLVAEGRYDAMITFRDAWEWDIAAGALIAAEAGAAVSDRFGAALQFNSPAALTPGVVCGGKAVWQGVVSGANGA
ncbi:3'(2'),5'-bisphosphate nucleotidase CysQ [Anianabacter salinae]|uniref:3'(2'),5'-bisphosphate nucleotidase CysQ n=1 Tax=Anianabacter salinae TaxID=2851023 RepID=UPI00225E2D46|nr:3'(2'),5'-bisphosphate nucleotidase CysQ [Anianabacter salinae]MBV0913650.1 3'(2'),5'-bisphosphate nucleotidase CysQ [Anianabacter salinae]